jgi:hypothetical protein
LPSSRQVVCRLLSAVCRSWGEASGRGQIPGTQGLHLGRVTAVCIRSYGGVNNPSISAHGGEALTTMTDRGAHRCSVCLAWLSGGLTRWLSSFFIPQITMRSTERSAATAGNSRSLQRRPCPSVVLLYLKLGVAQRKGHTSPDYLGATVFSLQVDCTATMIFSCQHSVSTLF